mgnify:CR=1 FL=1
MKIYHSYIEFENRGEALRLSPVKRIGDFMKEVPKLSDFPVGKPNDAYAKYFIGQSWLAPLTTKQVPTYNVTFEPRCRNNWHIHHAEKGGGQMLICVYGRGWVQLEGEPAHELKAGEVFNIPPNVKHWHGAAKDSWFQHLSLEVPGEGTSNEWLEPVTDEVYDKLP